MKLRNWHIDGFGCFHNCSLPEPGLGDGFNLIVGSNEAGKSTLLDFLRYTLFDYPDGRSSKPKREPLRGGGPGGAILYDVSGSAFRLERWRRKSDAFQLSSAGGSLQAEDLLRAQMGHVTAEVFRNVFGFSLSELQGIESLKGEEVVNLIFSAAIGESAGRIQRVGDLLRGRGEELFKERARARAENAPLVIRLQADLAEVEARLVEARRRAREAAGKARELDEAQKRERELKAGEEQLVKRVAELDRLVRGWDRYVRLCQARAARDELGDLSGFPSGGREKWKELKNRLESASSSLDDCVAEEKALGDALARLPENLPLLEKASQAEILHEERAAYETSLRLAADAAEKAAELERRWVALQRELGAGWDEQTVLGFDPSLLAEADARRRIEPLEAAWQRLRAAQERFDRLAGERGSGHEPAWERSRIEAERNWIADFRDASRERERQRGETRALETELHQAEVALLSRSDQRPRGRSFLPVAWTATAAVAGLAAGLGLLLAQQLWPGAVAVIFSLFFAGLAYALRRQRSADPRLGVAEDKLRQLHQEKEASCEAALRSLEELDRAWREAAEGRNLSWPAKETELVASEQALVQQEQRACDAADFDAAREEVARCKRAIEPLEAEWRGFLRKRRLPEEVAPDTALAIFGKIKTAAVILGERREVLGKKQAEVAAAGAHIARVAAFLDECGVSRGPGSADSGGQSAALLTAFASLREEIGRQREGKRKRDEIEERRREILAKIAARRLAVESRQTEMQDFLRSAGCGRAEDFLALAEKAEQSERLRGQTTAAEETLAAIFGSSGAPEDLRRAWDSGERPDWESEQSRLADEKKEVAGEREASISRIATIREELRRELGSDEIPALQAEAEALRAEIASGIEEWLEVSAALYLLRETRARFEKDHQPPALAEASRLFERVTGGAYRQVLMPLESTELVAVTEEGGHRAVDQLSRGTLEQLFLCVRLGYIRHFQVQRDIHLPLLMDDVAVNFDPSRMRNLLQLLEEFAAEGQQILFFSCHASIGRLLGAEARCFEVRDYRFHSRGDEKAALPAEA